MILLLQWSLLFLIPPAVHGQVANNNDACSRAIPLQPNQPVTGSTEDAAVPARGTAACGLLNPWSGGLWYSFRGNGNTVDITTCLEDNPDRTSMDTVLRVFLGPCGNLTCLERNDDGDNESCPTKSSIVIDTVQGELYYVLVHGYWFDTGEFDLVLLSDEPKPVPTPEPTPRPSPRPTPRTTLRPSPRPTPNPTPRPSSSPTPRPSLRPTPRLSALPSPRPTSRPMPRSTSIPTPPQALQPIQSPSPSPSIPASTVDKVSTSEEKRFNALIIIPVVIVLVAVVLMIWLCMCQRKRQALNGRDSEIVQGPRETRNVCMSLSRYATSHGQIEENRGPAGRAHGSSNVPRPDPMEHLSTGSRRLPTSRDVTRNADGTLFVRSKTQNEHGAPIVLEYTIDPRQRTVHRLNSDAGKDNGNDDGVSTITEN